MGEEGKEKPKTAVVDRRPQNARNSERLIRHA